MNIEARKEVLKFLFMCVCRVADSWGGPLEKEVLKRKLFLLINEYQKRREDILDLLLEKDLIKNVERVELRSIFDSAANELQKHVNNGRFGRNLTLKYFDEQETENGQRTNKSFSEREGRTEVISESN